MTAGRDRLAPARPRGAAAPTAADPFEALLASPGGVILLVVDRRLRITRAGPDAAVLAERPLDHLLGLSLIAAFGSASLDAVARQALTSDAAALGEADLGRLNARQFAVEAVPFGPAPAPDEAPGRSLVLALHEVTALKRVERVRRDFVANISHELRTPLASVKLLAETLSSGAVDDPATAVDFTRQIEREIDHLAQLVDELLELTKIESGETQLTLAAATPGELLRDVADRIRPLAERQEIAVRVLEERERTASVRVEVDADRFEQALLNLAHNAVKYSRPRGEIRLGWEWRDGRVRFSVSDDGIGIPLAHQARIFERFYKVNRSRSRDADAPLEPEWGGGSAGLGLAIVRHIVEAHGGTVGVESQEGVGSTFWIEVTAAAG
jgi:two-component system phosphate regulon sensor histidine kinase PhoR